MVSHDVAVVGGGCVGLSTAWRLAERGHDVCVIEKEIHLAEHQSGRNSGVLHPGFNYPPDSLKADFATEGTRRMKEYCEDRDVAVDECGVVVVAQDQEERDRLDDLASQADANGVETEIVDADRLADLEPAADGIAALWAPEAASVDSPQYVHRLARDAERAGATLYLGHRVTGVDVATSVGADHVLHTNAGDVAADYVVNAAGLHADTVARPFGVGDDVRVVPFRGEYYEMLPDAADAVNGMIYPTPDPELPFLGVHYTRRTDGKVIVGPNAVLAFGREAYRNTQIDLRDLLGTLTYPGFLRLMASRKMLAVAWSELNKSYRKRAFVAAARRLVPDVDGADFAKSYAGIRAQLVSRDGALVKDPVFEHGDRSTHVLNAVSPGLTCSLPFGEHLADAVEERL